MNGGLFSGSPEAPKFTKIARSYLIHVGHLDWTQINPDIFGSMIQAVADDEERGALGMHYTSVPNILKVLNPLFLDELRTKLEEAGDNKRKLLNLRNRMARIRVFDPACGSGNFLVIAYKEMREIEAKINKLRGEDDRRSDIPLTNFRGIELRHFSAEIARLALIIAEYQCDVLHRGQKLALLEFLPLDAKNWITCGNALRLDWLKICPPTGTGVKIAADDLFSTPLDQTEMDFENEGGETFVCGNPPYKGGTEQNTEQKADMTHIFADLTKSWKSLDYVCGWFMKFANYATSSASCCAFVCTNSIVQGEQVARLWPLVLGKGQRIFFAHTSFKWANLAAHNAGVTVVVIGLEQRGRNGQKATLFDLVSENDVNRRAVDNICPYLVPHEDLVIEAETNQMCGLVEMTNGNKPADGGHLILTKAEADQVVGEDPKAARFVRRFVGAKDSIQGKGRYCIWVSDDEVEEARTFSAITSRWELVKQMRSKSPKPLTQRGAKTPHAFQQVRQEGNEVAFVVPRHSSESRPYLPISLFNKGVIVADGAFAVYDAPLWCFALLVSQIHLTWIATVCGKIKTDYRYSSTLGWNTFPVPTLTEQNKSDLTKSAKQILLVREEKFPSSLADLYDPTTMPNDLKEAHEQNDETLERIYIGRRFKNDTERLEKLFEMYTKMTSKDSE